MIGIYKFVNKINNKVYVGQSDNIERRLKEHIRRTEQQIDQAIKKYGIENFDFEVIEECDVNNLNERENFWMNKLNSIIPNGYNVKDGFSIRGEENGRSKLTNEDIIFIRTCYKNKVYSTSADLWRNNFPELSQETIANVFFGKYWTHLMMDIYTKELEEYYKEQYIKYAIGGRGRLGEENPAAVLAEIDVIDMRIMYQTKERKDIFILYPNYTQRAIVSILSGQNWKHLPIYKKRKKEWVFPKEWEEDKIETFKILAKA